MYEPHAIPLLGMVAFKLYFLNETPLRPVGFRLSRRVRIKSSKLLPTLFFIMSGVEARFTPATGVISCSIVAAVKSM